MAVLVLIFVAFVAGWISCVVMYWLGRPAKPLNADGVETPISAGDYVMAKVDGEWRMLGVNHVGDYVWRVIGRE